MPRKPGARRGQGDEHKPHLPVGGRWRRWLIALLFVAALVVAVLHFGDLKKFAELLTRARPLWLGGALLLQLGTYALLAAQWWLVLRAGGCRRPMRRLFPLTISKLFADQVIPTAGVSGNLFLVDRLSAAGVRREIAVAAVILAIIAYYLSYALTAVAAVVMLWWRGGVPMIVIGLVGLLLAVATAIPAAALWLQGNDQDHLPAWTQRFDSVREPLRLIGDAPSALVRNPRLIAELTFLNAGVFVADALTMQCCLFGLGVGAPFAAAFVPFMMASIVVTLGPIPLGLGSFEAVSIGMLRLMGIPFEAALSATLLLRGFTLWLPIAAGFVLTRRELRRD
jgi:glycosyltransferase 2 family protein